MTSLYFEELLERYSDEIDDLRSDSANFDVLKKRLQQKRELFSALMPMIDDAPEMVACAFHGAFRFRDELDLDAASQSEPGDDEFPGWTVLEESLEIAAWARPLVATCLQQDSGDPFLVSTAVLEWLMTKNIPLRNALPPKSDEDDDETEDLSEAGEGWLSAQGFDDINR